MSKCLIGLGCLIFLSCSDNKVSQCNSLVTTINQTESALKGITQTSTPDIDALQRIATVTEQAVTTLSAVELKDRDLQEYQTRFQQFYSTVSRASQGIVAAYEDQNMGQAEEAYQQLEAILAQQESLVEGINQYCSDAYPES